MKLQSNFIGITLRHRCSSVNLVHNFKTPFPKNTFEWLLLILGKVGIDRFIRLRQQIDIIYEFGLKAVLKGLECKERILQLFWIEFPINN